MSPGFIGVVGDLGDPGAAAKTVFGRFENLFGKEGLRIGGEEDDRGIGPTFSRPGHDAQAVLGISANGFEIQVGDQNVDRGLALGDRVESGRGGDCASLHAGFQGARYPGEKGLPIASGVVTVEKLER